MNLPRDTAPTFGDLALGLRDTMGLETHKTVMMAETMNALP